MYRMASVTVSLQQPDGARAHSRRNSAVRGVLQGHIMSPVCFIIALHWIFRVHCTTNAGIDISKCLSFRKLEHAEKVSLLDVDAAAASHRLALLSSAAESEGDLVIAAQESFVQHVIAYECKTVSSIRASLCPTSTTRELRAQSTPRLMVCLQRTLRRERKL